MNGVVSASIRRMRRLIGFIRSQAAKTIAQPSRVFRIALLYGSIPIYNAKLYVKMWLRQSGTAYLVQFPRFVPVALRALPAHWLSSDEGKSFCIHLGHELFQHDRPEEAWQCLDRSLRAGRASTDEYLLGSMCLYHGLGRFRDAMSLLERSNERNRAEAERLGLGRLPYRVLDDVWARHIGHTATIDYILKLEILEGRDQKNTVWYVPRGNRIANRFLLQQVASHLRFVDDPADLPFAETAVQALHFDYLGPRLPDGTTKYFWEAASTTFKRWEQEGRAPLFSLPADIKDRGWRALHGAGVSQDAWFVALHVREGTYDGRHAGVHGVLNSDLSTYLPVIAEVTRRGGWVIRMGDPSMTYLPPLPNVIDYCHSNLRADWMDIFIAACCRFMVGTSSGPSYVPSLYGIPSVLTNWWPPAQRPWHGREIFIPKMLRRTADGGYLTLSETLAEPFSYCHSIRYLAEQEGVYVEDNDADLILAAVEEMIADLDGDLRPDHEMANLHICADEIYEANGAFGMGRLARGFLRRHSNFIG